MSDEKHLSPVLKTWSAHSEVSADYLGLDPVSSGLPAPHPSLSLSPGPGPDPLLSSLPFGVGSTDYIRSMFETGF